MKILLTTTLLFILTSCDTSTTESELALATEIEGVWAGDCYVTQSANSPLTNSVNEVFIYSKNSSKNQIREYSDTNCDNIVYTSEILNTTFSGDQERVGETFTIGEEIITNNGVTVKTITYQTPLSYEIYDIFLLQNNNTTLLFGKKCINSHLIRNCEQEKPTELNYNHVFTKI